MPFHTKMPRLFHAMPITMFTTTCSRSPPAMNASLLLTPCPPQMFFISSQLLHACLRRGKGRRMQGNVCTVAFHECHFPRAKTVGSVMCLETEAKYRLHGEVIMSRQPACLSHRLSLSQRFAFCREHKQNQPWYTRFHVPETHTWWWEEKGFKIL